MCTILASSSLSMTGNGSTTWRACAGVASSTLPSGPIARAERGDELLADRVERRVGHLGEQLGEVVEEQPRARRTARRSGCRCPSSRAASPPVRGHRGEQDLQLLLGVAEGALAPGHRGGGVDDVLALGQVGQVDQAGVQPLLVGVLAGELGLDLLVADDAARGGVDEEHPARLQPALARRPRSGRGRARRPREASTTRPSSVTQ